MAYLLDIESQTMAWFKALETEAKQHHATTRLDPLGTLALTLPPDPGGEACAWLSYIAAQAKGKNAAVNFDEHGVLVLVLPRYGRAEQTTMELTDAAPKGGDEGR